MNIIKIKVHKNTFLTGYLTYIYAIIEYIILTKLYYNKVLKIEFLMHFTFKIPLKSMFTFISFYFRSIYSTMIIVR